MHIHSKRISSRLKLYASAFVIVCPLVTLTACSHQQEVHFAPLTYEYLTPIFFNVAQISIQNFSDSVHYPREVTHLSPVLPASALVSMANTRFKAKGSSNFAIFTINRASLQEVGKNSLYGQMDVTFDIYNSTNQKIASVQASVNHTYDIDPSKGKADSRQNLYETTRQLMQDMNVELEYQIRQHLENWLVDASGAPLIGAIKTENLNTPSLTPDTLQDTTVNVPKTPPLSNDDLSAVFPAGIPSNITPSSSQTHKDTRASSSQSSKQSKYPVGTLGTLPQSALPNGY
ncbi:hypothetical protein COMNV_01609 [Commensalibacter sp. Nvir]|uniref:hypothetical protein n=1 Tax=Commensalibacter sp. Nvir TaxID=3069817 RepID=UPI002D2763B8|nr:hypothetical protein COMNV_01609 [Commensalibacter sp. Nvir]